MLSFLSRKRFYVFLLIIIMCCAALGFWLLKCRSATFTNAEWVDFWGYSLAFLLLILTVYQIYSTHDWNRRNRAFEILKNIKEENGEYANILEEPFCYIERSPENPISVEEIHKAICLYDEQNKRYIKDENNKLQLDPNKKKIREAIRGTLSNYEFICSGIRNGILDEAIVLNLMKGNIIKIYKIFTPYIDHINDTMYTYRNKRIWCEFKKYAQELIREKQGNRSEN